MFNMTLKYFSIFNHKPPASLVAHVTRDFIKYCNDVMKKHFNKELVITEEDNKAFFKFPLNVESVIILMLVMILK